MLIADLPVVATVRRAVEKVAFHHSELHGLVRLRLFARALRKLLVEQVTARVRWRESVEAMAAEGITTMVECGAGKVLSVMNRRTAKAINGVTLGTPEELEKFANSI